MNQTDRDIPLPRGLRVYVVTGANGFIGSAMVWELNQKGHKNILAVDRVDLKTRSELLKPLKYDQFMGADEFLKLSASHDARDFKGVFHMGACSSTTEMDEAFLKRINTDYTRSVFESSLKHGWPLLYASSGAVYGGGENGFDDATISEKFKPLNPYGWSKANFDVWAERQRQTPPNWYGLRFFNVYGPNEYHKGEMSSVVFKAVQQIKETGRLKLFRSHHPDYKDGEQLRDFVYVKDITNWMWQILNRPQVKSGIYNMGFGQARSWLDLAKNVFKSLDRPLEIEWIDVPASIRNQYQYFTEAKMTKLMQQGLTRPAWSLEDGVKDYVSSYLKNHPTQLC